MRIRRVLNNNIVLAIDDSNKEKLLMGKGLGFNSNTGDIVDQSSIEKIFVPETDDFEHQLVQVVESTPNEYFDLTHRIVQAAQVSLGLQLNDIIYIGLTDHIRYAVERFEKNQQIKNALIWEIKKFYPLEYQEAKRALTMIEKTLGVSLTDDEASFIAMHFVNAQQNGAGVRDTVVTTKVIQDILTIIRFHFKIEFDESSLNFNRFITHIRFLMQRIHEDNVSQRSSKLSIEDDVFNQVLKRYRDTYECVLRIRKYFIEKLHVTINQDEMLYLMLHINRLTSRNSD